MTSGGARPITEAGRRKLADLQRERWKDPAWRAEMSAKMRVSQMNGAWQPPAEYRAMFHELRTKVGKVEARRLIEEHAAIVKMRAERKEARP